MNTTIGLSGYRIIEELYSGTRTLVYQGIRDSDKQPVVIKLLRNEYPSFNELVQFRNQYMIAKNLDFPSIIATYSLELYNNSYALIMEDFGGISLKEWGLGETKISLKDFLEIAIALCNTLDILYRERVIHKDIKPANILINPETKQIKLIDFSIASLLPRETQEIQNANALEGTLAYLSPEQTGRMNRGIDYRSDFYSLGVTFYELLTGQLPFISNDPMELVHCHLAKTPISAHQINPQIPLVLSEVISKLMAKNAEDRYQSVLGIKHDLELCLQQLQETGQIEYFEIGERDLSDRFTIPEKLYGREQEVQALLNAFDRVAGGSPQPPFKRGALEGSSGSEMMLVAGFSGIGKTAVVNEVHKPIARQRGYFIKGKYDQFQRNIPFSAFVQAFRDLMGQLLSESDAQLQIWKAKILEIVGDSGQVLVDVIPELELIIGKQPIATELSGTAAQNRFNLLIQNFVKVFTSQEHPLVMFIDDLQWSDSASQNLLKLLMQDTKYLLILGAYRDNEVSPAHPFMLTVDEIVKSGAVVNTITLQPLSLLDTNYLVADTLNCDLLIAQPLTELVYQKTIGNPFFTTQFLKALYEDKLIVFDSKERYWQCDIAKIQALAITDDVVEFMALQLQRLPGETQNALKLAACIGAQFDLDTLAIISEKSTLMIATVLWRALQEGFVIPITKTYKFFTESDNNEEVFFSSANPIYRFLHDRVQQAAYSLIPPDQKQATHLEIGQLLQENSSEIEQEEKIFDIVGHLNIGIELITAPPEQETLARLNLKAGQKARSSTAYSATKVYLQTGIGLLKTNPWQSQYELTLNLYVAASEAAYLNGDFEELEEMATLVLQEAQDVLDKVKIYEILIAARSSQSKQLESFTIGVNALKQLGIEFPSAFDEALVEQELQNLAHFMEGRRIEDLVDLPVMTDAKIQATMQLLSILDTPIFQTMPDLLPVLSSKMISLSLQFGNTSASTGGYSLHGMVLCAFYGEVQTGYYFGRLALALLERLNTQQFKCLALAYFGTFIQHQQESLRATIPTLKDGYAVGIETGDFLNGSYSILAYCYIKFLAGTELDILEIELADYSDALAQMKQYSVQSALEITHQTVQNLRKPINQGDCLIGIAYDETAMIPKYLEDNELSSLAQVYILKLMLAYLWGNYTAALDNITHIQEYLVGVPAMVFVPIFHFYAALTHLTLFSGHLEQEQAKIITEVETHQTNLESWVQNAPMNYLHKSNLVEAEKQRILGNKAEAMDLYDRAISGAKEHQFLNEEALANELAAKFYLDWGKEKIAQVYMIEAYYCYSRWGAKAKVADLETRYPQLLQPILQQPKYSFNALETLTSITQSATKVSNTSISDSLDFASVIQTAQALSSAIELDELLKQLTQIILQNSGGNRCVLVLPQDDIWCVRAISTLETTELCSEPLDNHPNVPIKLIQYVKRTQSVVVINNLQTNLPVIDDYLIQRNPKSILCLPILNQGNLAGILYLKNQATAGVFTSDRLTIINFLCTQAAISLENARLYQESQQTLVELQTSKASFQKLADNLPGAIYQVCVTADGSMSMPYVSSGFIALYEISPEDFMQGVINFREMEHPDDSSRILQSVLYSAEHLTPFREELRIITPSGKVKWLQFSSRPERQADGSTVWDGVILDVSDRKQAEADRQQKSEALEKALEELQTTQIQMIQGEKMSALGNLVAGVAHEINNPIGFIAGNLSEANQGLEDLIDYVHLYQEKFPEPGVEVVEKAEEIDLDYLIEDLPKILKSMQTGCDRIKFISKSLRTFSRSDTDQKQIFDLHEGIDSTILILRHRLKANEQHPAIEVVTNYGNLPPINCFPGQLNQVFMNILANAIDALDESNHGRSFAEIKANPNEITITTTVEDNYIKVVIADNGKGMSEEVKAKIFDHLFTTKGVGKGTGLGLAIARQIVEQTHGGSLYCHSVLGKGTEFIIEILV